MMRKIIAGALVCACLLSSALAADFTRPADALHDLGLLQGTTTPQGTVDYALDSPCTRAEAGVMLVRLLGKENEAKAQNNPSPFTDLYEWQKPYVGWLYANGLTTGTSATTFEPEARCTAQMYASFVLRALGYGSGDFTYDNALTVATQKGVYQTDFLDQSDFRRDDAIAMSYLALSQPLHGQTAQDPEQPVPTLLEGLQTAQAITAEQVEAFQTKQVEGAKPAQTLQALQEEGYTAQVNHAYKQGETTVALHGTLEVLGEQMQFTGTMSLCMDDRRSQSMEVVLVKQNWWEVATDIHSARYTPTEIASALRTCYLLPVLEGEILQNELMQAVHNTAEGHGSATVGQTQLSTTVGEENLAYTVQSTLPNGVEYYSAVTNAKAVNSKDDDWFVLADLYQAVRL